MIFSDHFETAPFLLQGILSDETFIRVEEGDEVPVGGIRFLEKTGQVQGQHMIPDPGVFPFCDPAVQAGDGDAVAGNILAHKADGRSGGELIPDPGEQAQAF